MPEMFVLPFRPVYDANGKFIPGAKAWFTLTGTNVPSPVYFDDDLAVPLTNPIIANAAGKFPKTYLDPAVTYRVRIYDDDVRFVDGAPVGGSTPIEEYDPYTATEEGGQGKPGQAGEGYPTRALMAAATPAPSNLDDAYLTEAGREGKFVFSTADLSAQVAADTSQGMYIAKSGGNGSTGAWVRVGPTISVKDFGAKGDGTTDDTAAIRAAFTFANALVRTGLVATIHHPGCTVLFPRGVYSVSSIAATIPVKCNVVNDGAGILVPPAYAGEVLRVGYDTATHNLATADIHLPDLYKASGSAIVAGSVGLRLVNLNACRIKLGRINYFDYGVHVGGIGEGTVYCRIDLGQIAYCNRLLNIVPGSGGWFNSNTLISGNLRQGGSRVAGTYHIYMDGNAPATAIVGNTFVGTALEGDGAEYVVWARNAYGNTFVGAYHETGTALAPVTVSGDTLTATAHGLVVGDMLMLGGAAMPTGMFDGTPYYVVAVPDANTFKLSLNKGGAAITFTSTGTAVTYRRQARCYFDGSALTYGNEFINPFFPPSNNLDFIDSAAGAYNNGTQSPALHVSRNYAPADFPMFRGANVFASAATGAVFAAYGATVNPVNQPTLWSTAVAAQGLLYKDSAGVEQGRVWCSFGALRFESANSGTSYEIPSTARQASYTTVPAASVIAAGDRLLVSLTCTGAATGDFVSLALSSALAAGLVIGSARVSAANTVQVCIQNVTASGIDAAGTQIKALCSKAAI